MFCLRLSGRFHCCSLRTVVAHQGGDNRVERGDQRGGVGAGGDGGHGLGGGDGSAELGGISGDGGEGVCDGGHLARLAGEQAVEGGGQAGEGVDLVLDVGAVGSGLLDGGEAGAQRAHAQRSAQADLNEET